MSAAVGALGLQRKARAELAVVVDDVRARLAEHHEGDELDAAISAALGTLGKKPEAKGFDPQPLALDFDAIPDPPDWLVHGVIERGTVAMFAGDTGSAKSLTTSSLIVAALKGQEWFGHETAIDRVLVIDEENPSGLVLARLRALGLSNAESARLQYFNREGFDIGAEGSDERLRTILDDFRPDLVVVDTLMSATATADTNSNSDAVRMMKQLRALAAERGLAVLLLHHERKTSTDGPASGSSQQTMGARQWVGQADALLTIARESDMATEDTDDGGMKLRRTFKFRPAEKDRDGRRAEHRRLVVESEKDDRGRLLWMTVTDDGPIAGDTAQEDDERRIVLALRAVDDDGIARGELAALCGEKDPKQPRGTFKRALKDLAERGLITSPKRGYFALTAEGRTSELGLPV